MLLEANKKLLFIGDSVTDTGRAQPVGEGRDALGNGYVRNVDSLLFAVVPEKRIRVVNVGTSGNTARDLKNRWERDVVNLKPDYVSIMIGINDVWRQFDSPLLPERHVLLEEYSKTLRELVSQTVPTVEGMVLMTPFYIEERPEDSMRKRMDEYGAVVRGLAEDFGTVLVDTQAAFNKALEYNHSAAIAWDRVHPNAAGHMILAKAWLDAVGFEWK